MTPQATQTAASSIAPATHRSSFDAVRTSLRGRFFERDDEIDGLLAAILAQENVLLLGPPGSGKSALVRSLLQHISGARGFTHLLTKFTTPEELFGVYSLKGLEQDSYRRITAGMLPEAHIAFIDEIVKSSSAILNTLLTIMNERIFKNDAKECVCPLVTVVGASNEIAEGHELAALDDRFIIRFWTRYITVEQNWQSLVFEDATDAPVADTITLDQLAWCQRDVSALSVPQNVRDIIGALKTKLSGEGLVFSDRRWKQLKKILRAYAYIGGASEVSEDHIEVLAHGLWTNPKDITKVRQIVGSVGNPVNIRTAEITTAIRDALQTLGTPNLRNPTEVAEWMKNASTTRVQIAQMLTELENLQKSNGGKSLPRLADAIHTAKAAKMDLIRRCSEYMNT